jgi:disulfide bond formation protein DsbB
METAPPLSSLSTYNVSSGWLDRARLLALGAPALLLGGALGSQYIGGLYPCEMCMWQRWPHLAAIILALIAYMQAKNRQAATILVALAALAIAISGAIGIYHAGVEYHWWQGLTACTSTLSGSSVQDVLDSIMAAPITRCDTPQWTLFGISLAGFNALFSLGSAILIALLLRRSYKAAS